MGLIARVVEESGIPTLTITSARDITESVRPPRSVFLNFPLGHQGGGRPFDREGQMAVIKFALNAAETIKEPGYILDYPQDWGLDDDTVWEQSVYRGPKKV